MDKSQTGRNMTTEFALRAKSLKSCVYPVDVAERTRVRGRGATRFLAGGISGISVYILHYSVLNRISKYFIHFISDSVSNRIVWLYSCHRSLIGNKIGCFSIQIIGHVFFFRLHQSIISYYALLKISYNKI